MLQRALSGSGGGEAFSLFDYDTTIASSSTYGYAQIAANSSRTVPVSKKPKKVIFLSSGMSTAGVYDVYFWEDDKLYYIHPTGLIEDKTSTMSTYMTVSDSQIVIKNTRGQAISNQLLVYY